jgi:Raf kinase inhibitor-like YbhB/YbcL family protein
MAFSLTSPAFSDGDAIPRQYTCEGDDEPPPLRVAETPAGARSFALIVDDPDAPRGTFTHWLAYDIPLSGAELDARAGRTLKNGFGREGYGGPCPPPGHGPHRYVFTLHALDVSVLELKGSTKKDLEAALDAHSIAHARLLGRYERPRR